MKTVRQSILDCLAKQRNGVTFAALEKAMTADGVDYAGNNVLYSGHFNNCVMWEGWNEEAVNALSALKEAGAIQFVLTNVGMYMLDGKVTTYPIADKLNNFDKPHWMPTLVRIYDPSQIRRDERKIGR